MIAQHSLRPASWKARSAPSALGSLMAPTNWRRASVAVLCCDNWGDILVGLKLDDQVHFFADQEVCIALRDLRAVAVIERNQFNPLRNRRSLQAGGNLSGESIVGSLCSIPEAIQF